MLAFLDRCLLLSLSLATECSSVTILDQLTDSPRVLRLHFSSEVTEVSIPHLTVLCKG